jgi:recombination protein RecT
MSAALATLKQKHTYVCNQLELSRPRLQAVIPLAAAASGFTPARAIAVVLDALSRTPSLLDCEPRSIVQSVLHAAELGLELGSPVGEAYLVPFAKKSTMMIGYRGFVKLIRGAPRVTVVKGVLVREQDEFEIDEGENRLVHKVRRGTTKERGRITHAYSRVYYTDGSSQFEVMDIDELDKIKTDVINRSKGRPTPWKTHPDEMYKKCPLRRQAKWLQLTHEMKRAVTIDDDEAARRGEIDIIAPREGFMSGRNDELKDMLAAQQKPVEVIDADFEEAP